jgi:hypothetical protein
LESPPRRASRLAADAFSGRRRLSCRFSSIYYILWEIQTLNTKHSGWEAVSQGVFHAQFRSPKTTDKTGACGGVIRALTIVPPLFHSFVHRPQRGTADERSISRCEFATSKLVNSHRSRTATGNAMAVTLRCHRRRRTIGGAKLNTRCALEHVPR